MSATQTADLDYYSASQKVKSWLRLYWWMIVIAAIIATLVILGIWSLYHARLPHIHTPGEKRGPSKY